MADVRQPRRTGSFQGPALLAARRAMVALSPWWAARSAPDPRDWRPPDGGDRFIFGISVELTQAQIRFILLQVGKSCQQSVVEKDATTMTARQASIRQRPGYDFAGKTQVAKSTRRRQEGAGEDRRHRPLRTSAERACEGSRKGLRRPQRARFPARPDGGMTANSDRPKRLRGAPSSSAFILESDGNEDVRQER